MSLHGTERLLLQIWPINLTILPCLLNIPKATPNPYCGQESIFYILSILIPSMFYPHTGEMSNLQHSKRNNRGFKNAHCRCSTPYFLASQRLALVGVKQASFRDDISLSLFFGKNKSKTKLINFAVLVFVINKAVPSFCSRQNFILSNSHHTFLTNSRIGL